MTGVQTCALPIWLAEYFDRADVDGAKAYFLQAKKERPDLLMEASDITGELHASGLIEPLAVSSGTAFLS